MNSTGQGWHALLAAALLVATAPIAHGADGAKPAPAAVATPPAGTYLADSGSGTLVVRRHADGSADFTLEALGVNGHSCGLDGAIVDGIASLDIREPPKRCVVSFHPDRQGVGVAADTFDECRTFCGARASFDDSYYVAPAICQDAARRKAGNEFGALYKAGKYDAAYARLAPTLQACDRFLGAPDDASLRDDLAITLFHLARHADCKAVLAPVLDGYPRTEDELRDQLPPADFEALLPYAKAAWHNDQLCSRR